MDFSLVMALVQWGGMWVICGLLLSVHVMLGRSIRTACAMTADLREIRNDLADTAARLEALAFQVPPELSDGELDALGSEAGNG